ncbi:MAG: hypothetical protein ACOCYV_01910 [Planctomycetota bacterium]
MTRLLSFVLLVLPACLVAADGNGEMERPKEAAGIWARQEAEAARPSGPAPVFTGCQMWGGRADRDYKPFFQWEIRLQGGTERIRDLRFRIVPLDARLELIGRRPGYWRSLGELAAGATTTFSYKLNCPSPMAYRCELEWQGGSENYYATDKTALPEPRGPVEDRPMLMCLEPMQNYIDKRRLGQVGFYLRNDGGAAATGVSVVIELINGSGETVKSHTHVPDGGTIEPGYAEMEEVEIPDCPPFSRVRLKARSDEEGLPGPLDPGRFTDVADIEVAEVAVDGDTLQFKVRNGLPEDLDAVTISFDLENDKGQVVKHLDVTTEDLSAGEIRPLEADTTGVEGVAGYQIGIAFGAAPPESSGAGQQSAGKPSITAAPLVLTLESTTVTAAGLEVSGTILNSGDGDLPGVTCTLEIGGPGGGSAQREIAVGDLPASATHSFELTLPDLDGVAGMGLSYTTGG